MRTSRRTFLRTLSITSTGLIIPSLWNNWDAIADPRNVASGFVIVENGQAHAAIVTAAAPSPVVTYAATELQQHIELATGARMVIVTEKDAATSSFPNNIYIGSSAAAKEAGVGADVLPLNGCRIKTTSNALFLVGKDSGGMPTDLQTETNKKSWPGFENGVLPLDDSASMGSLFAVYHWLENQLGVMWIWPDETGTVVPKVSALLAGAVGMQKVLPSTISSMARTNTWAGMDPDRRGKYIYDTNVWMRRQRFARGVSFRYGPMFNRYWNRFGETHPEYFALLPSGKREPVNLKRANLVQMCVSNVGLQKQVIEDWLVERKERPDLPWINGVEDDTQRPYPSCTCDVCRSWDPAQRVEVIDNIWISGPRSADKTYSVSDRYAKFWLALQQEGKKHDPDAKVIGYAYANYSLPPVETKLNRNIIVGIVPPFTYPLKPENAKFFQEIWDGWAKTGASLYLRPNNFLSGYDMPYIFAKEFGEDYRHAARNGLIATDYDSLVGMWGVQGINLYMMGRLNVNPKLTVAQVLDDYYAAFGSAGDDVRRYFDYWEHVTSAADREWRFKTGGGWSPVSKGGDTIYTAKTFVKGKALLDEARKSAGTNGEVLDRIGFLRLWLDHADLTMKTLAAFHRSQEKPEDEQLKSTYKEAKTTLDGYRKTHADKIVNVGFLHQLEVWSRWRTAGELKK